LKNFFKPGNTTRPAPAKAVDSDKATSSSDISQFQKTFKPFVVKKDTTVAPVNWFHSTQKTVQRKPLTYDGNVIVIDDEDNARPDTEMEVDLGETSAQGLSSPCGLESYLHYI
jgi:chromatin assembly factor 1 subunit A